MFKNNIKVSSFLTFLLVIFLLSSCNKEEEKINIENTPEISTELNLQKNKTRIQKLFLTHYNTTFRNEGYRSSITYLNKSYPCLEIPIDPPVNSEFDAFRKSIETTTKKLADNAAMKEALGYWNEQIKKNPQDKEVITLALLKATDDIIALEVEVVEMIRVNTTLES